MANTISGIKTFSFGEDLVFQAYVQFKVIFLTSFYVSMFSRYLFQITCLLTYILPLKMKIDTFIFHYFTVIVYLDILKKNNIHHHDCLFSKFQIKKTFF